MADQAASVLTIAIDIQSKLDELLKSQEAFRNLRNEARSTGEMLKTGFGIDAAHRAITLAVDAIKEAIGKSSEMAAEISRSSRLLGVNGDTLQVLAKQARSGGADFEAMTLKFSHLKEKLGEALLSPEKDNIFRQIGLDAHSLAALPFEQQLEQIAKALGKYSDANVQARLTQELFGRHAIELAPMLQRLRTEGYQALAQSARDAGVILDPGVTDALKRVAREADEALKLNRGRGDLSPEEKRSEEIGYLSSQLEDLGKKIAARKKDLADLGKTAKQIEDDPEMIKLPGPREVLNAHDNDLAYPKSDISATRQNFATFASGKNAAGGDLLKSGQGFEAGLKQWAMATGSYGQQIASTLQNTIGNAVSTLSSDLMGLIEHTKSIGDVARDMGAMFVQALIEMTVRALAFAAIMLLLNSIPGWSVLMGGLGATSGAAGVSATTAIGTPSILSGATPFALPGRASGGPVAAGQPYLVGEHRPELFVPSVPGTIVPNLDSLSFTRTSPGFGASSPVSAHRPARTLILLDNRETLDQLRRQPEWDTHVVDTVQRNRGVLVNG